MFSASLALTVAAVTGGITLDTGCTPAQTATVDQVTAKVLADLEAGDSLSQIEGDVQAIIKAASPTAAIVVDVVDEALALLAALGDIPPGLVPTVTAYRQQIALVRAAAAAASVPAPGAAAPPPAPAVSAAPPVASAPAPSASVAPSAPASSAASATKPATPSKVKK